MTEEQKRQKKLATMRIETRATAPKLWARAAHNLPDPLKSAVWIIQLPGQRVVVGSAKALFVGLRKHLSLLDSSDSEAARVWVVESGLANKEVRLAFRQSWINRLAALAPPDKLLNSHHRPSSAVQSFEQKKFQDQLVVQNRERIAQLQASIAKHTEQHLTLKSPKGKLYRVRSQALPRLWGWNYNPSIADHSVMKRVIDKLKARGWHVQGLAHFEPKTAPPVDHERFARHPYIARLIERQRQRQRQKKQKAKTR